MPPRKIFAFSNQAIGASRRQPLEAAHITRRQPNAVLHLGLTMPIITTTTTLTIEQFAADVGEYGLVGVLVDQFVQTASTAPIAQAFPLGARHLRHCLAAPEWNLRVKHGGNLSMRSGCTCSQAFRHGSGPEAHFGHFSRYFSFTLVPASRNRSIGCGVADRLKLLYPAFGRHLFKSSK